ncbi:MAG TPA: hypothetical protein VJG29_01085 [Candidatus Paceibacterota bacterium]
MDVLSAILYSVDEGKVEELLRKNLELAQDNHRMLRAMRRSAFFAGIFRVLWWILILGVPIVLYYLYLEPILGQALSTYAKVEQGVNQVQGLAENLEGLPEPIRSIVQTLLQRQGQ